MENEVKFVWETFDLNRAAALADTLAKSQSVTKVDLGTCSFGGIQALVEAFKVNTSVRELHLYSCRLSSEDIVALSECLKVNETLTFLDLSSNGVDEAASLAIGQALKVNRGLKHLVLFHCGLSSTHHLAEAIKFNETLTHLELPNNEFLDNAAPLLEALAKKSKSIRHVNLSYNNINDALAVSNIIQNNLQILSLNVSYCSFPSVQSITDALANNGTIISCMYTFDMADNFCQRNKLMHERAFRSVATMLSIPRQMNFPKEIWTMMGQYLWNTRGDIESWTIA